MPESQTVNLDIWLSSWIIEDGNYVHFDAGETRKFAVEFWSPARMSKTNECVASLLQSDNYSYSATGKIAFATDDVLVIDCGVLAYSERKEEVQGEVGDFVKGNLSFGIDPYFYFEYLYKIPSMPPLIYEWHIDTIVQDTTPFIEGEVCGRPAWVPDEKRRSFRNVSTTRNNVAGSEHVLRCTKVEVAPIHNRFGRQPW